MPGSRSSPPRPMLGTMGIQNQVSQEPVPSSGSVCRQPAAGASPSTPSRGVNRTIVAHIRMRVTAFETGVSVARINPIAVFVAALTWIAACPLLYPTADGTHERYWDGLEWSASARPTTVAPDA